MAQRKLNKKQEEIKTLLKELKEITKHLKDKKIIASVEHVSSSGMSRIISFHYVDKRNNYLYNLNYKISKILGYTLTDKGVRVGGCGMDMIFHCLYSINSLALHYGVIRPSKNHSKHDLQYCGLVNTSYNYL